MKKYETLNICLIYIDKGAILTLSTDNDYSDVEDWFE